MARGLRIDLADQPTAFVARDWTSLVEADPSGTFFHTPAYLKVWWEEFGSGELLVAFVRDRDVDVAACAVEVVGAELRFLGGFDVTDYMGPVGLRETATPAAAALVDALGGRAWERADLRGLPEDSPWLPALERAMTARGLRVERTEDDVAPFLKLPPTREQYLASVPAKLRHEMRRKARRLVAEAGEFRTTLSTPESAQRDLDEFFELHRGSPGPKGRFMHAGMEFFFRRLAEAFLAPHVFHVAFLDIGGKHAAGAIGFGYKSAFSLYNSAFDRAFEHLAPGMVLVAELIGEAIESGREVFDLLKGDLGYKYRFGASPRAVRRLVVRR
jgi:CelD/BcsL family acetyltransferase involved in cellulose biosynthesis